MCVRAVMQSFGMNPRRIQNNVLFRRILSYEILLPKCCFLCVITTHTRTHIIAANGWRVYVITHSSECRNVQMLFCYRQLLRHKLKSMRLQSRANNRMICIIFHDARRQTICARNCVKDLRRNEFNLHKETGSFAFLIIRSADDVVWRACI